MLVSPHFCSSTILFLVITSQYHSNAFTVTPSTTSSSRIQTSAITPQPQQQPQQRTKIAQFLNLLSSRSTSCSRTSLSFSPTSLQHQEEEGLEWSRTVTCSNSRLFSSASQSLENEGRDSNNETDASVSAAGGMSNTDNTNKSIMMKIKSMFSLKRKVSSNADGDDDNDDEENLTTRQKLAKMGFSVLLTYGFVSNMSASIFFSLAWFSFSAKTGLSPLAPNQWKSFTVVYAGFYVLSNFVRPARIALSIAIGKYFDQGILWIEHKLKVSKKVAIGVMIFAANVCGSFGAMGLGIFLASLFSGVPIFPK